MDPNHAFYLGYEMAKAVTALTLGKDYRQDQALDWGYLTKPEIGCGPSGAAARVAGSDKKLRCGFNMKNDQNLILNLCSSSIKKKFFVINGQ